MFTTTSVLSSLLVSFASGSVEIVGTTAVVESQVGGEAKLVCMANSPNNSPIHFVWSSAGLDLAQSDGIFQNQSFRSMNRQYYVSTLSRCHESRNLTFLDNSIFQCRAINDRGCSALADIDLVVRGKYLYKKLHFWFKEYMT